MATLIESVDDMDEVYIPSFNVFMLNQNETAAATKNAYIKKLSDDSLLSILKPRKANEGDEEMAESVSKGKQKGATSDKAKKPWKPLKNLAVLW
jgi:hypothetical protein